MKEAFDIAVEEAVKAANDYLAGAAAKQQIRLVLWRRARATLAALGDD